MTHTDTEVPQRHALGRIFFEGEGIGHEDVKTGKVHVPFAHPYLI